jgi:hypothetical protein
MRAFKARRARAAATVAAAGAIVGAAVLIAGV